MKSLAALSCGAAMAALPALAVQARAAEAHPDFTGVWQIQGYSAAIRTIDGKAPPLKPEAKADYERRLALAAKGDRSWDESTICLPQGLPRLMLIDKPFQIMQRPKAVFFLHQENRLPHKAFFNEALPKDPDGFYLGQSVARWEGPVLVVESNGFREGTFLDDKGLPHSDALHLTERYRLGKDGRTMSITFTVDDPKAYARAWTARATYVRKPAGFEMPEEVCADRLASTAPKR